MKSIFNQILSGLMALAVLFSTVSFTVDAHYCGDKLVSKSVFKKADDCGIEMVQKSNTADSCKVIKTTCCRDEQSLVKGQDDLQQSHFELTIPQFAFLSTYIAYQLNLFEGLEENVIPFIGYRPSLVVRSIYKLDEVYLI